MDYRVALNDYHRILSKAKLKILAIAGSECMTSNGNVPKKQLYAELKIHHECSSEDWHRISPRLWPICLYILHIPPLKRPLYGVKEAFTTKFTSDFPKTLAILHAKYLTVRP